MSTVIKIVMKKSFAHKKLLYNCLLDFFIKVAFKPRQDCRYALRVAPTKVEIVASNGGVSGSGGGHICHAKKSKWTTLATASKKFKGCREDFFVKIPKNKRASFRCFGIRALDSPSKKVALARVRMWETKGSGRKSKKESD